MAAAERLNLSTAMTSKHPMFEDALCPVLTKYPAKHPHMYALYVSRKHLPLKILTFVDHCVEFSKIPRPWHELETV